MNIWLKSFSWDIPFPLQDMYNFCPNPMSNNVVFSFNNCCLSFCNAPKFKTGGRAKRNKSHFNIVIQMLASPLISVDFVVLCEESNNEDNLFIFNNISWPIMALYNYIKDCVIKSIKIRLSLTNSSASCYLWCHGSVVKMTTTLKMAVTATATSRWFISISWQGGLLNYQQQQFASIFYRTWWMTSC